MKSLFWTLLSWPIPLSKLLRCAVLASGRLLVRMSEACCLLCVFLGVPSFDVLPWKAFSGTLRHNFTSK